MNTLYKSAESAESAVADGVRMVNILDDLLGRIVMCKSGHDKGVFFAVVGVSDDNKCGARLLLSDGRRRKAENPKAKNIKHIAVTAEYVTPPFTNKVLRRALRKLNGYNCGN